MISIFWEVLLPHKESAVYIWEGESYSTSQPVVSFYFCLCFTNVWRDLWVISWTESLCKSRNANAISLWHDKGGSCRYWSKSRPTSYPSASTAMSCSKSQALGALVHAASLSHDLCDGTHGTDVPRAKTSELKLLTVNPQFTLIQAFQLMLGAIHLLYYSTHVLNFW